MKTVEGDLLKMASKGEFDVIIHGCNCFCDMSEGIAKSISSKYPEVLAADSKTVKGSREKLGDISYAVVGHENMQFVIVNAYTQYHWKGKGILADYTAIHSCMTKIKNQFKGMRIGYPRIGAGLAGGDWSVISQLIKDALDGEDHTLVEYKK